MHWRNSRFQVVHFLVGKCHTPDEAYRVLKELREERDMALKSVKAADLRAQAKLMRARNTISRSMDEIAVLEARADVAELEATKENSQACIDEAQRELTFIDEMIERIQPHRVYKDLPDHEAFQLCQQEEWKQELLWRAENYICTGGIPADHFATMRMHPEFEKVIAPRLQELVLAVQKGKDPQLGQARPMQLLLEG